MKVKDLNVTLYKRDTKSRLREVVITTNQGVLTVSTGLVGGAKVSHVETCEPKNLGKINKTSSSEQAVLEATSKITKKLKEGYFKTIEEAKSEEVSKPMLAKEFGAERDKIIYPAFVQPKLDGIRALKTKSSFVSRKNTPISTMTHIEKSLSKVTETLDGELYCHGESFQENTKLIKKKTEDSKKVKYYVYDLISSESFKERYKKLTSIVNSIKDNYIVLVPTFEITSEKELEAYYKMFIEQGYEGLMLRHGEGGYKCNGRSSELLKYKKFIDRAYPIIDVTPANKNKLHGVPVVKVTDQLVPLTTPNVVFYKEKGVTEIVKVNEVDHGYPTTRCGARLSHEEREELLKNKTDYIGKTAEIRFFEFHDSGVPRFPIYHGIRIDK